MAGHLQEAVADLAKSVELAKANDEFWNELALAWYDAGRYDQAAVALDRAIELNASDGTYFRNRGDSYQKLSKHPEAIADFTKSIAIEDSAELRMMRGNSYQSLGDAKSAKADFEKATQLDSSYSLQDRKYLKVVNDSGEKLSVHLIYYTRTTEGKWQWFPGEPGGGKEVIYTFEPGETRFCITIIGKSARATFAFGPTANPLAG